MGITRRKAQEWANALRSGEYSQTMGTLEDEQGFCCLGVACKIFIPEEKQLTKPSAGEAFRTFLQGDLPTDQLKAPKWLKEVESELSAILKQNPLPTEETQDELSSPITRDPSSFTDMNDDEGYTFDEIADIIELIFVHKALK